MMRSVVTGTTHDEMRPAASFAPRHRAARALTGARAASPIGGTLRQGVLGITGRLAHPAQSGRSCMGEARR